MGDFEKRKNIAPPTPGLLLGLLLIGGGTLLFLDNLNVLPFRATSLFWPLVFICYGGVTLMNSESSATRIWGAASVAAGLLLLLNTFGIVHVTVGALWPLALIAAGVMMLTQRLRFQQFTGGLFPDSSVSGPGDGDRLHEFAMFSGIRRKVLSANFEGGELSSVFGGIEIDLRRAGISSVIGQAVIEANAAFGGIEIRVPETWRVSLQGNAIFGGYDDKTMAPRPEPGIEIPLLIIRGGTAFGGVSITN